MKVELKQLSTDMGKVEYEMLQGILEVDNYHIYPIADNDIAKLSADRLEYSLSNALCIFERLSIEGIKEIYEDIDIQINEENYCVLFLFVV